ncbi:hypothetical protein EW145_g7216 [Phellinidium pouzarii]|uniref:CBM1 domain-containing protein n=1 Tax=Phellinidium pouzarii TaxID=167371 RepID=A0A4S4KNF7_9AGAM|nr:hypothetical protein EW145_g7216 [Phellinidium pouzarii]
MLAKHAFNHVSTSGERYSFIRDSTVRLIKRYAQQAVWQQCGGIGWAGETTCISGSSCTVLNDYYSQCIPGEASSSSAGSTVTSTSAAGIPTSVPAPEVNYWFSFGDSYTQTGFVLTDTLPSIGNPLGNPPYPGYTAVGGVNWIDVDTVQYNRSLILTYNYAYGGATIDASLVAPYEPTVLSLTDQVNEFLGGVATKPASAPWTSANSLFSFWIGINDIGNSYYESGDRDAFSDTLLDAYFTLVQNIMQAEPASAQALEKTVIAGFNSKLADRVTQLKANYTGVSTRLWDSYAAFSLVLDDPTAFGFIDNTSYGNPGDFWGNNYHSSSQAQQIWGQNVSTVLEGTIW